MKAASIAEKILTMLAGDENFSCNAGCLYHRMIKWVVKIFSAMLAAFIVQSDPGELCNPWALCSVHCSIYCLFLRE
jgi:hypothetical protein